MSLCNKLLTSCWKRGSSANGVKTQRQMAALHRLSQVESASTIVTMAYDPIGPRNSKIKDSTILSTLDVASGFWTIPVHPMTNTSWHSPLATDSTPSHGAPSAMPTHQQNSKFFLAKHALTPESEATLST